MSTTVNQIEKTNLLRKEFLEVKINHDELLSLDQFYLILDKKAKKQFDRELGNQMYEKMNKGFGNKITIDEFIKVFLQAEEILKNKIEGCKKSIIDYNQQRQFVANQFESIKSYERVNQYGIKENSELTIQLIEGFNFPPQNVQVICQLEEQKIEIKEYSGPYPKWNQTLNFHIRTGLEELQLFFYTINHPNNPQLLGTVTISLSILTNQNKINEKFQVFNKTGQKADIIINLQLQWIYSETKLISQNLERIDEQIKSVQDDLLDYQKDLVNLYEPFPNYVQLIRNVQEDLKINHQPPNTLVMTPINNAQNYGDYKLYSRICILIILGISTFICFAKAQFLDIIICFLFINDFQINNLYKSKLIYYGLIFGISLICDLIWTIKYSKGFWGSESTETDKYFYIEKGPNRLALILIYLTFIFKLLLIVLVGLQSQEAKEEEQKLPTQNRILKQEQFNQQKYKTAQFGEEKSTFYNY